LYIAQVKINTKLLKLKRYKRNSLLFIGVYLFTWSLFGQIEISEEDQALKFQNHFFEALKQKAIKNYKKAIVSLENCMEIDENNTAVFFEFSKNYLLLKNYQEAELFVNKALEKNQTFNYLLLHKVAIFKAQQQFESAIRIQEEIVKSEPNELDKLVQLYLQNQDYEKAASLIESIEQRGLNSSVIQGYKLFLKQRNAPKNISEVLENPEGDKDLEALKKSYEATKDFGALVKLLELEFQQELFEELYLNSKAGLEIYPSQPILYIWNAVGLNKLGKYKEAIAVLSIGIDFVIGNKQIEIRFFEEYSKAYKGLGDNDKEDFYLKKISELRKEI